MPFYKIGYGRVMWFHMFTGNHDEVGTITLYDMMEFLSAGLRELGHEVTVGDTIAPNAVNIIWENFFDDDVKIFEKHCFKFGLIATEIPTDQTFNWLEHDPWLTRRRCFDQIASRASFIWSMMESSVRLYKAWAPSGFLEMGFSERLVDPVFSQTPEFDFGFYGLNITPYRRKLLEDLKIHCSIVTPNRFVKGRELNSFISSFKVGLCLRHMPNWPVPSPCRVSRLLHAKRGIAAEYVPIQTGPSALIPMAPEDQDFASFCVECVQGPWKQRAEEAFENFRAALPMRLIMERLLDETLSPEMRWAAPLATEDNGHRDSYPFRRTDPRPQLLESREGVNYVRFNDRIYALAQKLGPLDLASEASTLLDRFGPDVVAVADTIESARSQLKLHSDEIK
jgi:hypothetical protein